MFQREIHLAGKTAIVTGASRGIGAAITETLLQQGMQVWATGRDATRLELLSDRLSRYRASLRTRACDNRQPEQIERLFAELRHIGESLYLLVNNAGTGIFGPVEKATLADWDTVMDTNARGVLFFSKEAFTYMRDNGGGRIVNIASVVGLKGYVDQSVYSASKHAVMGLTKSMAREGQAHGIRVCAVCPGGVATDMLMSARPDLQTSVLIQPADVARAVLYLATEPQTCCTDMIQIRRSGSTPFD